MPFLVDSVTAELNRRDLIVDLIVHPVLRVRRDEHGQLLALLEPGAPADEGWANHSCTSRSRGSRIGRFRRSPTASGRCWPTCARRSATGSRCGARSTGSSGI